LGFEARVGARAGELALLELLELLELLLNEELRLSLGAGPSSYIASAADAGLAYGLNGKGNMGMLNAPG
jgi:hypothetical protein